MIEDALDNWARWLCDMTDIGPGRPVSNWDLITAVEYKNCYLTTDEKLEQVLSAIPIDELAAVEVEREVCRLPEPFCSAIRIQWVTLPEYQRVHWRQTYEQWQTRRSRFLQHELAQAYPGMFHIKDATDFEDAERMGREMLERKLERVGREMLERKLERVAA